MKNNINSNLLFRKVFEIKLHLYAFVLISEALM